MSNSNSHPFAKSQFFFFLLLSSLVILLLSSARSATAISLDVVISEFRVRGPSGGNDEFVELYNLSSSPVDISGWLIRGSNNAGTVGTRATILAGTILDPGCYYLITNSSASGGPYSGAVAGDQTYGTGITDDGGLAVTLPDLTIVDQVGMSAGSAYKEGTPLANLGTSNQDRSYERKPGGAAGSGTDTDDNSSDFQLISPSDPQNSASSCVSSGGATDPSGSGSANPDPVTAGDTTLLTVAVTPGTNPTSTGLAVVCDLTEIGGSASQAFFDDGSNGDVTAGDNTFSFQATVDGGTSAGSKTLACTISDDQARSGNADIPLTVQAPGAAATLVINEIDYDQPGTDTAEFIEIKNTGPDSANLSEYTLELVNGSGGAIYGTFNLPAVTLAAGGYFVVCGDAANVANCDLDVSPDSNLIQNGAPDAVGLRHNGVLVDAVSYEGNTAAPYTEGSGVGLEDNPTFDNAGISRCPDGTDTDQNNVDFSFRLATPGAANACLPVVVINEIDYDQPGTDTAEFIELRNNDIFSHDLSNFTLELVNGNGGGAVIYNTIALANVVLAPGDYYVICANAATVANCDLDSSPNTDFIQNGAPDAVGLRYSGALIDAVSYEGDTGAPYTEGSGAGLEDPGTTGSDNLGISRCPDGVDTNQNNVDFTLDTITPGAANNCTVDVPPTVDSTNPADGTPDASINTNITINFSEDVTVSGSWFDISCGSSGVHTAVVSGGPQSYTLDPDVDFTSGESCTVTIFAANVADQDGTADNMEADYSFSFTALDVCSLSYTPIYDIQGSGLTAAITGPVTTQGVVIGDYEGPSPTLRGFYIQDATGDGDTSTSDGIFVFNFDNDNVNLGDVVRVTGSADEFQDQTQIGSVSSIAHCGTDSVTPVDVTFPVPDADYLERYEGMLVRLPQTLYVTEHFQLGRFGQVVLSADGRLQQPTNVTTPGAAANALQAANNLNRIIIDDDLQSQNPDPILFGRGGSPLSASNTLRGGDTATGIVGIMTYTWAGNAASGNAYRVRPINALDGFIDFQADNARPDTPEDVGGTLKVTGMNLLNFFNTFDGLPDNVDNCNNGVGGAPADCRGADTQDEFDRQWPKTVAAIVGTDADVIGVIEIENDGYGPDSALQFLIDQLNAATASGTYAFIDADAGTGQVNALGTDAIKVGLIYKTASVTPVGTTAALNTVAFVNGGDSAPRNRPALAQAFEQPNGAIFIAVVNHLKSKGSACDDSDAGDGQGNCNTVRTNAANELAAWLASDPTGTGDSDVLVIGDLNAYAMEDPITALTSSNFTNLIAAFNGPDAYSYVFDGQWGYLDHALGSVSLVGQVTGVTEWHINADEPGVLDYNTDFKSAGQIISLYSPDQYRVSDHDPVIVGLDLNAPPVCETAVASRTSLWPPNHMFVNISVLGVTDPDGDPFTITITSIFQDEAVNAPDSGNTSPDGEGIGTSTARVRAERVDGGNGRVYHIYFTATDIHGNSCSGEVLVGVPANQSGGSAIDDGPLYDSTMP